MTGMTDAASVLVLAALAVAALGIASVAALKGWDGWLALKRLELARGNGRGSGRGSVRPGSPARIDLADLKARVRRLEAIATGTEL